MTINDLLMSVIQSINTNSTIPDFDEDFQVLVKISKFNDVKFEIMFIQSNGAVKAHIADKEADKSDSVITMEDIIFIGIMVGN